MPNKIYIVGEKPELREQIGSISGPVWPEFMHHDPIANRAWDDFLWSKWAHYQLALCDEAGKVIASGQSIPVAWDGHLSTLPEGWDAAAEQGMHDSDEGREPNAISAYSIVVAPGQQGKGLSSVVLNAMREMAKGHGMHSLVACVRPTLKDRYPLTPIERYASWKQPDGSPFDPWMRVHWRAGAEIVRPAPRSMLITGSVADWEEWTGMRFPESGPYVVPGALIPIEIDVEGDLGRYIEPNVWMWHKL